MIIRLAMRSLAVRPIRTAVLACGFGLGIAVMAALLGVGDVILEQARSPELAGGGDMVVSGVFGTIDNAPFVLSSVRGLAPAASPSRRATVYLLKNGGVLAWGNNAYGQTTVPAGLSSGVTAVSAGSRSLCSSRYVSSTPRRPAGSEPTTPLSLATSKTARPRARRW